MSNDRHKTERLAQEILNYLEGNPQAGDTLEGIAQWWLAQQIIDRLVDDVAVALEKLVKDGAVEAHSPRSGSTIYKIKH